MFNESSIAQLCMHSLGPTHTLGPLGPAMSRLGLVGRVEHGHDDCAWACSWGVHCEEEVLLTGSLDESARAWAIGQEGPTKRHVYQGNALGVGCIAAQEGMAAATGLDSTVRLWSMGSQAEGDYELEMPAGSAWGVSFLPHEALGSNHVLAIAGGTTQAILLVDYYEGKEKARVGEPDPQKPKERFVHSVTCSADGSRVAASTMGGGVVVADVAAQREVAHFAAHSLPVRGIAFCGSEETLLAASDDGTCSCFDLRASELVESYAPPSSSSGSTWLLSVAAHPDGKAFATAGSDGAVRLWELGSRQPVQTMSDFSDAAWDVAFNPTGSHLGAVSEDASVAVYDLV